MDEAVGVLGFDTGVHEQDIRRAANRPGNLDSPTAQRAVDRGIAVLPYIIGKRVGAPNGTTVQIDITDPIPRTATISVSQGRAVLTDPTPQPTVRLAMDAETFCCLGAGRWSSSEALQHGAALEGDQQLGTTICNSMTYVP
ncbi:MAG: hypothetical protein GY745_07330 [Actinomycetia bacterium]|nr:hypothetical protein [Actinomycetes bacterium]